MSDTEGFPRRLGPYVLLKPLARGGMGALYLAIQGQTGMEKLCVVKTALPHLADRSYLQRFRDEAKVVVRLSHGNLVTVFDAGEVGGELFLAMDFVEGKDLRAVWNRCAQKGTAFPIAVAVHIVKELVRGLGYAHAFEGLSLVHRDVSPPNVLVSYSGEVKLTDFGLATSTLKLEKTAPGLIYGKVSYMAPEQARGEPLDGRTDLYSASVILWELLTGRQLFPPGGRGPLGMETEDDLLERVRKPQILQPSRRATRVPAQLDAICLKALAADPKGRYQTGEELRSALAAFLAKTAPSTDGAQLERFLRDLFGDEIAKERAERERLVAAARGLLGAPVAGKPKAGAPDGGWPADEPKTKPALGGGAFDDDETTRRMKQPEEISEMVGTILAGRYHIRRLCGEGGMGRVYEAEHIEIGKRVAVKVLHPAYTRTPDVVERFRREARAASKIEHPNVVNVTDSGTTSDGCFFFVMEYIEGVELGYVIHKQGSLEVRRALRIAEQMSAALAAAHDVGVIHRDLKPENILLVGPASPRSHTALAPVVLGKTPPGTPSPEAPQELVKVLDFGIAKSAEMEESTKVGRRLTRPGVAMGTPEYMAPEQAAGKPADPRSDIYAVGSILYEMLSGAPPYEGENVMEVLHKKANEAPRSLREMRPDVPPLVEALAERAMARSPDARPQSMGALAEEIRAVQAALASGIMPLSPTPARGQTPLAGAIDPTAAQASLSWSRRGLAVGAAALTAVGLFVVVRAANRSGAEVSAAPPVAAQPPVSVAPPLPAPPLPEPAEAAPAPPAPIEATAPDAPDERPPPARKPASQPRAAGAAPRREILRSGQALLRAQRYDEAREAFSRLLTAPQRERAQALIGLGDIAFQEKKYQEAVDRAREAMRFRGGVAARILLGDAYFKLNKYEDAQGAYAEALKMDPKNVTAKLSLERVTKRLN